MSPPVIIQGGMGVGVSHWGLARAVSLLGHLGVVSGTLLATVLIRRLQDGDAEGHVRRALQQLPVPALADRILSDYFVPGGIAPGRPYKLSPLLTVDAPRAVTDVVVAANFVEVFLAKEGHGGKIGINLLEKLQLATLPSLYGAMLAGVDYVLMGAGIPRSIPGVLDRFAAGQPASLRIDVQGDAPGADVCAHFDPSAFLGRSPPSLLRPEFLAVISSATLATTLLKKSDGRVDGFVVEGNAAGGHNAPPRGPASLNARGEPVYGPRDMPDYGKIRALGVPFWIAGFGSDAAALAEAQRLGAHGLQVGTAFAFCDESGIEAGVKREVLKQSQQSRVDVFTDPRASPTDFPFKVVQVPGSISDEEVYRARRRLCDLGYLRVPYRTATGALGYRCPGEQPEAFVAKGGALEETAGRKCLCNGLLATVGLGQVRSDGQREAPLVTAGDAASRLFTLVPPGATAYAAADVIRRLDATGSLDG